MTKSSLEQKRIYSGIWFQKERVHYGEGEANRLGKYGRRNRKRRDSTPKLAPSDELPASLCLLNLPKQPHYQRPGAQIHEPVGAFLTQSTARVLPCATRVSLADTAIL